MLELGHEKEEIRSMQREEASIRRAGLSSDIQRTIGQVFEQRNNASERVARGRCVSAA
jgi:hypothetical protein